MFATLKLGFFAAAAVLSSVNFGYAKSCTDIDPIAQPGPVPDWSNWRWGNACYIAWPGSGSRQREAYEKKCREIEGFLHFEGDYGANRNVCVIKLPKTDGSKITTVDKFAAISSPADLNQSVDKLPKFFEDVLNARHRQLVNVARQLTSHNFVSAINLQGQYVRGSGSDDMQKAIDMTTELKRNQQDEFYKRIYQSHHLSSCISVMVMLSEHLGFDRGMMLTAEEGIQKYQSECEASNPFGLNPLFYRLKWRYENLSYRIPKKISVDVEEKFMGYLTASQCKGIGGSPQSTVTTSNEKDPKRGCWRHIYADRRTPQFSDLGPDLCPDGSPVSTTRSCSAR